MVSHGTDQIQCQGENLMDIVDGQTHATHRGIDQSIAIMDAVGVNAAIIDIWPPERTQLPNGVFRFEYKFGEEAVARFPARFAYVARFEAEDSVGQLGPFRRP